jgi:hypothetical protein
MNAKFLITPSSTPSKYLAHIADGLSDASAFFHASLFFAFSAFSQRWLRVIASDDDGGGQRYIRSSSNVGPVDPE